MGLSFSVKPNQHIPASLMNIFTERYNDLGIPISDSGDLSYWAKQGVLLLNSSLTVTTGIPASHKDKGWNLFTDGVIDALNKKEKPVIYILWGSFAKSYKTKIDPNNSYIIESVHPSPLSAYRGFFGSKPFSKVNNMLKSINEPPIDWRN